MYPQSLNFDNLTPKFPLTTGICFTCMGERASKSGTCIDFQQQFQQIDLWRAV